MELLLVVVLLLELVVRVELVLELLLLVELELVQLLLVQLELELLGRTGTSPGRGRSRTPFRGGPIT